MMLRVRVSSVVIEGRSVTLYEEVHPQQLLADAMVELGMDIARSRSK